MIEPRSPTLQVASLPTEPPQMDVELPGQKICSFIKECRKSKAKSPSAWFPITQLPHCPPPTGNPAVSFLAVLPEFPTHTQVSNRNFNIFVVCILYTLFLIYLGDLSMSVHK